MKKKDPKEKAIDLLNEKLPPGETGEVISVLAETGIGGDEIEQMKRINKLIDRTPVEGPSSEMDKRFGDMLSDEINESKAEKRNNVWYSWFRISAFTAGLRIAAGIALFIMGWFMASWTGQRSGTEKEIAGLSAEVKDLKTTLVISMMNQTSSLERIKAVNMVSQFENADGRIIRNLIDVLNNDENINVRLLSLEALIRYSDNPAVREGLIESIPNQSSPMIQIRLAEIMVALNEKRAATEFQKVLMNAGLNYSVRNKINEAVTLLL